MSVEKFIRLFEQEFDEVPAGTITPEMSFKEVVQMNSMNAVLLLGLIKAEYNIDLTVQDLFTENTFASFYETHIQLNE